MDPQIPAMTDAPTMDIRTFGINMLGYQPGQRISKEEFAAVKTAYDYYIKKVMDRKLEQPAAPKYMSLTNTDGRVVDVLEKGDGTLQVIEPKFHNTRQGIVSMVNPTNAVPVTDPTTGKPYQGYAADFIEEGDTPKFGQTNATTVTPTNAPTPPAFDPTTLTNAFDIRDALRSGKIDRATAQQLLFKVQ